MYILFHYHIFTRIPKCRVLSGEGVSTDFSIFGFI